MQFVILEVCVFSCTATVGYSTHPSVTVPGVKPDLQLVGYFSLPGEILTSLAMAPSQF